MVATLPCFTAEIDAPATTAELCAQLATEHAGRIRAEAEAAHLRLTAHLADRSPNPLVRLGRAGQLQYANAAAFLVPELVGPPDTPVRQWLAAAATAAWAAGTALQRELALADHDFLVCAVPVPVEEHTLFYLTDVTALRAAEAEVRTQHTFYETVLKHMPAAVAVLDSEQRLRYRNPAAREYACRLPPQTGQTFGEYCRTSGLPMALAARRKRLFRRAVAQQTAVDWAEEWPASGDQPLVHWLRSYQPVFHANGTLHVVISYGLDVTTRRRAEATARASEAVVLAQREFMAQVLDLNPNLIYVRKPHAEVVFQNRAMLELRQLVAQLADTAPDGVPQAEQSSFETSDTDVVLLGRPLLVEDHLTLPNGEVRWYQSMKCPLVQPDGTAHVLCVSTDITTLKAAQLAAEAAATARENFLANMSHEIRTPLHGVLGMASLLAKTTLDTDQQRFVGTIQHTGQHLLTVVNDVLDMAKITSGQLELEQRAFNLCESMSAAAQPLAALAQQKGIRVMGTRLSESCPHPWVVGDPYRLNQILLNLLSNAIKFTPVGGTISVDGYFVSETDTTNTTEFRVTDTGIGISADKLEAIFQEFTQAYADTARYFGGTGLGLSISRALVLQMGGTLRVESQLGLGSSFTFSITLPKASAEQRAAALAPPPATTPSHRAVRGRRVLLAEDNPVSAEVAQLLLAAHGVRVDVAVSGPAALDLFAANTYDAVLMDIQMPGMNGLEVSARLRAHPNAVRAATPILALTANAFRADADKYRAAGLNDTLAKPYVEAELLAKLAALLGEPLPEMGALAEPVPTPVFDLARLRVTARGSLAFINRILEAFHGNVPGALAELRAAQATTDLGALAALAHRLRPSLQLLGAASLEPHLAILEAPDAASVAVHRASRALIRGLGTLRKQLPRSVPA